MKIGNTKVEISIYKAQSFKKDNQVVTNLRGIIVVKEFKTTHFVILNLFQDLI